MANEDIIVGLDVGSTSIKIAVGQRKSSEDKKVKVNIIGAIEQPAEGINRGVITTIEDAVESVAKALDKAEGEFAVTKLVPAKAVQPTLWKKVVAIRAA